MKCSSWRKSPSLNSLSDKQCFFFLCVCRCCFHSENGIRVLNIYIFFFSSFEFAFFVCARCVCSLLIFTFHYYFSCIEWKIKRPAHNRSSQRNCATGALAVWKTFSLSIAVCWYVSEWVYIFVVKCFALNGNVLWFHSFRVWTKFCVC